VGQGGRRHRVVLAFGCQTGLVFRANSWLSCVPHANRCNAGRKYGRQPSFTSVVIDFFDDLTEGARDGRRQRRALEVGTDHCTAYYCCCCCSPGKQHMQQHVHVDRPTCRGPATAVCLPCCRGLVTSTELPAAFVESEKGSKASIRESS
jgi:hypothetical protein